jgi:hypothetical protein
MVSMTGGEQGKEARHRQKKRSNSPYLNSSLHLAKFTRGTHSFDGSTTKAHQATNTTLNQIRV